MKELNIEDISYNGEGVGRCEGKVIFVPFTDIGEKIEFEIERENSRFCQGKTIKNLNESRDRIEAKCPYFSVCGGCNFQHITREKELFVKKENLKKELKKVGFFGEVDVYFGEKRFAYRNKIKLKISDFQLGFHGYFDNDFIPISHCELVSNNMNILLKEIENFLKEEKISGIKSVLLREKNDEFLLNFEIDKNVKISEKTLKKYLKTQKISVFCEFFDKNKKISRKIFGNDFISYEENNIKCEMDINSFFQVNDEVARSLYNEVLKNVEGENVVNAYSGAGLLTCLIAQYAKQVYGIEIQKSSHIQAENRKEKNNLLNVKNIIGKCEEKIFDVVSKNKIDTIVLDPARAGCDSKVLKAIVDNKIDKIIYVSCNPATLVRDLKLLDVYEILEVKMFDMFPCTANSEVMVVLKKK